MITIIIIMWGLRSKSANKIGMPVPQDEVNRRKNDISKYHRQTFSKQTSRAHKRAASTAIASTRQRYRQSPGTYTSRQQADAFPLEISPRPFTTAGKCSDQRLSSPLSIIRTCSRGESSLQIRPQPQGRAFQKDFLKRGTSIDKTVIKNVLKSKLNLNVCSLPFSYSDHPQNEETTKMVMSQIPMGIRDVVGIEQMMRMTHILTGVGFKTVNMNAKLAQTLLRSRKKKCDTEEEDAMTLRSIKRW